MDFTILEDLSEKLKENKNWMNTRIQSENGRKKTTEETMEDEGAIDNKSSLKNIDILQNSFYLKHLSAKIQFSWWINFRIYICVKGICFL